MFTYIKAKNFKSLKDINFDMRKTQKEINKLIVIYGENGSGKTNIVELFKFLQQSILAKANEYYFKDLLNFQDGASKISYDYIESVIGTSNIRFQLNDYRTIDENEITELEYGFELNEIEGIYSIKFDNEIKEEKLYYIIDKQRGYLFDIEKDNFQINKKLNSKIFKNQKYNEELEENIDKYWGKYSFLSLMNIEFMHKNAEYITKSISDNLSSIIYELSDYAVHIDGNDTKGIIPENFHVKDTVDNLGKGRIESQKKEILYKYEELLKLFFTQAYSDIKDVKYEIDEEKELTYYELIFSKAIGGKIKNIPYHKESEGTKRIVKQFDTLIGAINGKNVIIDEIDNGIHDLLIKNIIMSIKEEINGQLIVTTHNTLLLESLPKEYIYILISDYEGNKQINSISDYETKVQKNNNARDLYLKGAFGGIPLSDYIDFETIKYVLNNKQQERENKNAKQ